MTIEGGQQREDSRHKVTKLRLTSWWLSPRSRGVWRWRDFSRWTAKCKARCDHLLPFPNTPTCTRTPMTRTSVGHESHYIALPPSQPKMGDRWMWSVKGVQGDFAPEQLEGWTHCSFKDNGVNCEKSRCGEKIRGLAILSLRC